MFLGDSDFLLWNGLMSAQPLPVYISINFLQKPIVTYSPNNSSIKQVSRWVNISLNRLRKISAFNLVIRLVRLNRYTTAHVQAKKRGKLLDCDFTNYSYKSR